MLGDTRNQPVIALPCFDHGRVSLFPPVQRRSHDPTRRSGLQISHRWRSCSRRREEIEASVRALELSFRFEISRGLPPFEPLPLREPATIEIYVVVSR